MNEIDYSRLPEHMRPGMQNWIEHGIYPSGFLTAVLENNLMGAVGAADHIDRHRLLDIVMFLYNEAPSMCWGSTKEVGEWHERGGLYGQGRTGQENPWDH